MFEFVVKIPDEVVASGLFEDAATVMGWTPTITDADGNTVDNPVSAIATCLYRIAIPQVQARAMEGRIARETKTIHDQAMKDIDSAGEAWIQALQETQ